MNSFRSRRRRSLVVGAFVGAASIASTGAWAVSAVPMDEAEPPSAMAETPPDVTQAEEDRAPEIDVDAWPILSVPAQPEPTAWSDKEKAAITFTKDVAVKVRAVLDDPVLGGEARRLALKEIVNAEFEVDRLSRILLGPHLATATPSQIAAYSDMVTDYLVSLYAGQLRALAEPDALIVDAHDRGDALFVRTALLGDMGDRPLFVDWRVIEQDDGSFRLLDMAVDGVSLAQAKRDEFDAVIANKGFGGFLDMIYEQAGHALPDPISAPATP